MAKKKYDVYGLGNALVDYEIECSTEELEVAGIEKGVMTLIDENRRTDLMEKFLDSGHRKHKRACGGSAANTLIGLTQLGGQAFYNCKVANDDTGKFFTEDLKRNRVSSNLNIKQLPDGTSGTCLVLVTPDADRTMNTYLGVSAGFSTKDLDDKSIAESKFLYIEGYLVTSPSGKEAALHSKRLANALGVKTSLTFSDPSMVEFFSDGLKEMIGDGVDFLFCNKAEAEKFSGSDDIKQVIEALSKHAKSFAITLGAKGAVVSDQGKIVEINGFHARAVDTNGAGDLFAGAVLYGINNGYDLATSAKLACFASSKLVEHFGPRMDPKIMKATLEYLKTLNRF